MRSHLVLSFSAGAAAVVVLCCACLVAAIVGVSAAHLRREVDRPRIAPNLHWQPLRGPESEPPVVPGRRRGEIGDGGTLEHGPLNTRAADEIKSGGPLSRLLNRDRDGGRYASPNCPPATVAIPQACAPPATLSPTQAPTLAPCLPATGTTDRPPETGSGLAGRVPAAAPTGPLPGCPDGSCPSGAVLRPDFAAAPRGGVKTGGFACAACGQITVGQNWATDWDSGEPVTYCCRRCYDAMTPAQKRETLAAWSKRQQAAQTIGREYPSL
jgi:hypothetical protein